MRSSIVNVTADQFGLAPVLISSLTATRYLSGADTALPEFRAARAAAVAKVWTQWSASQTQR
jgi:hypothetical protein